MAQEVREALSQEKCLQSCIQTTVVQRSYSQLSREVI